MRVNSIQVTLEPRYRAYHTSAGTAIAGWLRVEVVADGRVVKQELPLNEDDLESNFDYWFGIVTARLKAHLRTAQEKKTDE